MMEVPVPISRRMWRVFTRCLVADMFGLDGSLPDWWTARSYEAVEMALIVKMCNISI